MENTPGGIASPQGCPGGVSAGRRREAIQHLKTRHWQVSKVPPGSIKTVACVKRSERMTVLRRAAP
jgi:hypothetical protein